MSEVYVSTTQSVIDEDEFEITYLSRRDVAHIVTQIDAVGEVHKALVAHAAGHSLVPNEAVMRWQSTTGDEARSLVLPGMLFEPSMAGLKVINANPGNVRSGVRRANSITMLFDPVTARIEAMMEGAIISALRTAAVSALSIEACSSRPPEQIALIGSGELCRAHLRLFLKQFPSIERVRLFDIEKDRAEIMVAEFANEIPSHVHLSVVAQAKDAVLGADVVVPTTTTTKPYILRDWLTPGCTAVNVSLDDFEAAVIEQAEMVVVDDWNLIAEDNRRLLGKMQRDGRFTWRGDDPNETAHVHLGDVLAGNKAGRLTSNGIVYVNPFGLSIEDVALASAVHQYAITNDRGTKLPL